MASDRLSYQAIESLWTSAGGSKELAPVMAAIAIAESGGRPSALNDTPPDYSVGLWQINYYGSLLPGRSREFGSPQALLASPAAQARAAVAIERQQGLGAWTTYTSGAYRKYLNGADYSGGGSDTSGASGTGSDPTAQQALSIDSSRPPNCLFGFGLPAFGYVCLLTYGQARALLGGLLLVAGGVVSAGGLIILTSYGVKRSGLLEQVGAAAGVVPGGGKVAAGAQRASNQINSGGKGALAKQEAAKKQAAAKKTAAEKPAKKAAAKKPLIPPAPSKPPAAKKAAAKKPAKKAAARAATKPKKEASAE